MMLNTTAVLLGQLLAEGAKKGDEFDPNQVTPGVAGFIFTALVAVAVILLSFSLVSRLRRSQYRHEVREEIARELAARKAAGQSGSPEVERVEGDEQGGGPVAEER